MTDAEIDAEHFAARLAEVRETLLATPDNDAAATVELDQTRVGRLSRMDALQGQAMAQASAGRREQALKRIEAALVRISDGSYGYCLNCDEPIALARLEADPAAPLCVACAERREAPGR